MKVGKLDRSCFTPSFLLCCLSIALNLHIYLCFMFLQLYIEFLILCLLPDLNFDNYYTHNNCHNIKNDSLY